jgi:hypothetical protein
MSSVTGKVGDEELVFKSLSGDTFKFYHSQDCCESVAIEDITGDLIDLVGYPFLQAEEISSEPPDPGKYFEYISESYTWTFYKFSTIKGSVTVRWLGTSNGYYSESVQFAINGKVNW